jgi:hypothetical protein
LCGRAVGKLDRHHLIPRTRHSNKRNKRDFDREEVRTRIAMLCRPCHKQVHAVLTEKELARAYNTLAALREVPEIAEFVAWIRTRPDDANIRVRQARTRTQRPGRNARRAARRMKRQM